MKTILITGGTGLIGQHLATLLIEKSYKVIILTRTIPTNNHHIPNLHYAHWDVNKSQIDIEAIQQSDYIIHLAGAGVVDKKWTAAYKKEIVNSRTKSSELIVETLKKHPHKVQSIVASSAIGWYGPDKSDGQPFHENAPAATDFLGETCRLWEASISSAETLGIRVCKLRTGIVLSTEGGALPEFTKTIKWGILSILGSGKQMISWIHIKDLCRMFLFAIENKEVKGSFNAVAPHPVSNRTFNYKLGHFLKNNKFISLHVPSFILKIMMGERSIEVLKSTTVSAKKILDAGFFFQYPTIDDAFQELLKK